MIYSDRLLETTEVFMSRNEHLWQNNDNDDERWTYIW